MNLVTKIPVSYNNGIVSQGSDIVEGYLEVCTQQLRNEITMNFSYTYKTKSGVLLSSTPILLKEEEVNMLNESLKDSIPADLTYTRKNLYLYYLGMKVKMAETFGITVDDIEFTPTLKERVDALLDVVTQITSLTDAELDEEEMIQLNKLKVYLTSKLTSEEYLSLSKEDKKKITDVL